jgi:hypothetical protein
MTRRRRVLKRIVLAMDAEQAEDAEDNDGDEEEDDDDAIDVHYASPRLCAVRR